MTAEPIRIVVAGSLALMCDRVRAAIEALPDANLVGEVANGEQTISAVRELDPNVFILDMEIPGVHALIVTRTVL